MKQAETERLARHLIYPMHLAMFSDFLTKINLLRSTTQQEAHDPINRIKRINEFSWTMAKLKILTSNSLGQSSKGLTNFSKVSKRSNFNRQWRV